MTFLLRRNNGVYSECSTLWRLQFLIALLFLVKGYKDDWVTKEAIAEDADLAENPAEGKLSKEVK